MRFLKFILLTIITVGLIYVLDQPQQLGSSTIPPLGVFFSPFTGFWQNAETKSDFQDQTLDFGIFEHPVRIVYDDRLVPHVFAQNMRDAMRAQGYVTAQHRLWQMDISTRKTGGRLSEILGSKLLAMDKLQRRKGLTFAAENAVAAWKENKTDFALLQDYCQGVNAYIHALSPEQYPLEFKLLQYQPEDWTPTHTALFIKAMAQTLCMHESDLEATNALQHFGRSTFDFLYPEYNPKQAPIVPSEVQYDFVPEKIQLGNSKDDLQFGYIPHTPYAKPPPFVGSNNWAVAPSKTQSGRPIMCSDPHLSLTLPSIWYEIQIHTPDMNVYGVSLPGVPGVIMGFNKDNAWGMTNVAQDVLDWYNIEWIDNKKTHYVYNGQTKAVENRFEKYLLKDGTTVIDTVPYTVWGPIVYTDQAHPKYDLAMRWLAHDKPSPDEIGIFIDLNKSTSYDDYVKALLPYDTPAQNVAFANKDGDIALHPTGKFPLKRPQQGRMVQAGNTAQNAWQGFIPKNHNAYVKNPSTGFVGSANQRTTDPTFPYYYNGRFDDYRGRYLHQKLASMDNITVKDMMQLQNDNYSIEAADMLPLLLQSIESQTLTKEQRAIILTLEDWDYRFDADKLAPTFYELWSDEFYKQTWDEMLNFKPAPLLQPEFWRTVELFATDSDNLFFDNKSTPQKESALTIAFTSFETITAKLQDMKARGKSLRWTDYKNTSIQHLGRIDAFNFNDVPIGGFHQALNAVQKKFGPSWRMVVHLGDEVEAYGVYPGGQSGNPGSPFYKNMVLDWANGNYHRLIFADTPDDIVAQRLYEVVLK